MSHDPASALHMIAQRARSTVVKTASSLAVYTSKPKAVAALIAQAATTK
jgi:hypothetical protein